MVTKPGRLDSMSGVTLSCDSELLVVVKRECTSQGEFNDAICSFCKCTSGLLATYLIQRDSEGFSRLLRPASCQLQAAGGQWLG